MGDSIAAWEELYYHAPPRGGNCWVVTAMVVVTPELMYQAIGGGGLRRSTDGGATWDNQGRGYVLAASSEGHVYAWCGEGGFRSAVRITRDHALWEEKHYPEAVGCVSFGGVSSEGVLFVGWYRSLDDGTTWIPFGEDIPASARDSMGNRVTRASQEARMAFGSAGDVLLGSADGIWRSTDSGASWALIGLQGHDVDWIHVLPDGSVYALTMDDKVFVAESLPVDADPRPAVPDRVLRMEVYPNPTSSATTLEIQSDEARDADLVVVDYLGRVVLRRAQLRLEPGSTMTSISLGSLTQGPYHIRLNAGTAVISAPLIVIGR